MASNTNSYNVDSFGTKNARVFLPLIRLFSSTALFSMLIKKIIFLAYFFTNELYTINNLERI